MKPEVAAVIITRNESRQINACLDSLAWAAEIVVVDSCSTDDTAEICRRVTPRVFQRPFDDYASQRNFAQEQATKEWVLFADADERCTRELSEEILSSAERNEAAGYYIPRLYYFFGRPSRRGGWYPNYQLRLYRRSRGRWAGKVHERVVVEGPVGYLKHPLHHRSPETLSDWIQKINRYTSLQARSVFELGDREVWYKPPIFSVKEFLHRYLWLGGALDGMHGFVLSAISAFYVLLFRFKLWELTQTERQGTRNP